MPTGDDRKRPADRTAPAGGLEPTVDVTASRSPLEVPLERPAPTHIGPFELKGVLGQGGFGEVFLGVQHDPVERQAAIKVLRGPASTARINERFANERRVLAALDHPNIARILDAGEGPDGRPWIAMEYAPGLPITRYCDQNRLTVDDRVDLMATVAEAVDFAHEKGVVHRDLTPSNVLVSVDGGQHVPKVIDFGIAKVLGIGTTGGDTDQALGTPGYMAPEQTVNAGYDADPRTDVWSLGAMLHALLVGAPPGADPESGSCELRELQLRDVRPIDRHFALLPKRTQAQVAHDRRTTVHALERVLGGDLGAIVARCLDRDRMRRYRDAGALAEDLRRWRSREMVAAVPHTIGYRMRTSLRRNPAASALGAALAASVLVGGTVSAVGWVRASRLLDVARDADARSAREAAEARAATDYVTDLIASASVDRSPGGSNLSLLEVLQRAERDAATTLADRPATEAAVRLGIGRVYTTTGMLPDAQRNLELAAKAAEAAYGGRDAGSAAIQDALADVMRLRKDWAGAHRMVAAAQSRLLAMSDGHEGDLARNRMVEASILIDEGEPVQALPVLDDAASWASRARPADAAALSSIDWYRTLALLDAGSWEQALASAERNLAYNRAHLPQGHWWVAESRNARAAALAGLGRTDEAVAESRAAMPALERALLPGSLPLRRACARAAFVEERAGNPGQAQALRARALQRLPDETGLPKGTPGAHAPAPRGGA
jgi:serine/threonine protein kinase